MMINGPVEQALIGQDRGVVKVNGRVYLASRLIHEDMFEAWRHVKTGDYVEFDDESMRIRTYRRS